MVCPLKRIFSSTNNGDKYLREQHFQNTDLMKNLLFDTSLKQLQRKFAAHHPNSLKAQYLHGHSAEQLVERLMDIKVTFPLVFDYMSGYGHIAYAIQLDSGINSILKYEPVKSYHKSQLSTNISSRFVDKLEPSKCIVSNLRLHWDNDLLSTFKSINQHLLPDGCFLGALLGGDTLYELRSSLQLAEQERLGGFSPHHTSPMTTMRDIGNVLSESNFVLPTIDYEEVTIQYPTIFELLDDLELMGERNALLERNTALRKDVLVAASGIYKAMYAPNSDSIPATFQIIYFIGWKHGTERKPKDRGSAEKHITELL